MSRANLPLGDAPDLLASVGQLHEQARTVCAFEPSSDWAELAEDLDALLTHVELAALPPFVRRTRRMRGWR